ncbi:60S ribosomal protein L36-1-like isoform X1 [Papaver somniferum]|uniref:60S ribosomal protein L36-1-like isoform X1 n=2 Tax=Papaver somniferum TaxID=3469 RepID=UPI000E6F71FE|nr:60S ribosomal protein L36-1-like isoform X1 [Papaver somniferum]XP_026430566.1 60S ribosomal protein L36-1-like isoform X1 [Papaver somniferum]
MCVYVVLEMLCAGKMALTVPKSGLFAGLNKDHIVTTRKLATRPSARKGNTIKRVLFVRSLTREVAEFPPYEKRITELLKVGKDKRALKVAKRKLGTHKMSDKVDHWKYGCPAPPASNL